MSIYPIKRLSFQSVDEYRAYRKDNEGLFRETWLFHETLGDQPEPISLLGICDICDKQTKFKSTPTARPAGQPFKHGVGWSSASACDCGVTQVERLILRALYDRYQPGQSIYHVGHFSSFRKWLSERFPEVVSTQYQEGRAPGEVESGVRYEDITSMTFSAAQFDYVICSEILEHIPSYRLALSEMARVLKPGGNAILTFPWLSSDTYNNRTRATLNVDGTITHIEPAQYHGDPAMDKGILSFRDFGWQVLDDCRQAGFSNAQAEFMFGPTHGYMNLISPVIVAMR